MNFKTKYYQLCPHCNGNAWEYKGMPKKGMPMTHQSIVHKDNPKAEDIVSCGECKRPITSGYFSEKFLKIVNIK